MALVRKAPWLKQHEQTVNLFHADRHAYYLARLLGMFENWQVKGENTFITFNYDTVLEDSLFNLGLPFSYGLGKQTKNLDCSARVSSDGSGLQVLKLHGSLNWAKQTKRRGRAFTVFGNYSDVRKAGLIPELVPPTWKKTFQGQIGDVWSSAVRNLQTATRVVVIGFSMPPTDMHFKYLIAAGLQQNVSLRQIVFYNPAAAELKARALTLFRGSYIETEKIVFDATPLSALAARQDLLGHIGRQSHYGATIQFN